MKVNREDCAWAAGFFEGEGYMGTGFASAKHKTPSGSLTVTQVNLEPLLKFQQIFPFLKIYGPKKSNKTSCYVISTRKFEHIQQVIAAMWPWLSAKRKQQARKALNKL